MKVTLKNILWALGLMMVCYLATFSLLLNRYLPRIVRYAVPVMILLVLLTANRMRLKRYLPTYYVPWGLFFLFAVGSILFYSRNNLMAAFVMFLCIIMGILLMRDISWLGTARKILAWFTGLYVFFTFFFFLLPDTYSIMIDLYGQIPIGTLNGQSGYRAGLADHYSSNGIYISVFLMMSMISWMSCLEDTWRKKRNRKIWFLISVLAVVALLLTTKRGVLLWSLSALLGTYWIVSRRKLKAFLKLVGAGLIASAGLILLINRIPELNTVFLRFLTVGTDGASLERFAMWELTFEMFRKRPILGMGLWSFPDWYTSELARVYYNDNYMLAHNVYFQVLGETGLVGLVLYLTAVGMVLRETLRLVRVYSQDSNEELRFAVQLSLCIQIFYLLYSLTGNCLYDMVFYFYGLALAMTTAVHYYDRRKSPRTALRKHYRSSGIRKRG